MIRCLSAYLFVKPTHLVTSFARGMEAPRERWTAERVAGKRRPDIPVYILTSGNTISAAESFTFGLSHRSAHTRNKQLTSHSNPPPSAQPAIDGGSLDGLVSRVLGAID